MDAGRGDDDLYVPLREFVLSIMDERMRAHTTEHILIDRALDRAGEVVDTRLETLNNLRNEVLTDRALYMPRSEFDLRMKPLEEFRQKAIGFGALLSLLAGIAGAVVRGFFG